MQGEIVWTEDAIEFLRESWADPKNSTTVIGDWMGTTKNAIVGKAHRINLPGRLSPIKRRPDGQPALPSQTYVRGPSTLSALASATATPVGFAARIWAEPDPMLGAQQQSKRRECHFPGVTCENPAMDRRPYCEKHCEGIYRRTRDPLEQKDAQP